ncbi:MAG: hypothetical protein SFW66_07060 [Gammaproteobacteria bacterium]|nr:hypothetical protein [Gammaproteobacteria bacterium]
MDEIIFEEKEVLQPEEDQQPHLASVNLRGVVGVAEPANMSLFFTLYLFLAGSPVLRLLNYICFFPIAILTSSMRIALNWRDALMMPDNERTNRLRNDLIGHAVIDTLLWLAMGVAFIGSFFWTSLLSPMIFTGGMSVGLMMGLLETVESYAKARGQETEARIFTGLRDRQLADTPTWRLWDAKKKQAEENAKQFRTKAKVGAIVAVMSACGIAGMVGMMFLGMPAMVAFGFASAVVGTVFMAVKWVREYKAARQAVAVERSPVVQREHPHLENRGNTRNIFRRLFDNCFLKRPQRVVNVVPRQRALSLSPRRNILREHFVEEEKKMETPKRRHSMS